MFSFADAGTTSASLLSNKALPAALGLHFFNSAIQVICMSYAYALFLSTYPSSWIPALFIIQSIFDIAASYALEPFISKNEIKTNIAIYALFALIVFVFIFLLRFNLYWIPFVFTVLITTIGLLVGIIAWSLARSSLDIIEFKRASFWLSTAGAVASIAFGIFIAEVMKQTNLISVLPWFLAICLLLSTAFLSYMKPLPIIIKKPLLGSKPMKYPLYRKLFVTIFMVAISATLIEYCFKYQLAANYDSTGIAEFTGYYISASSVGALFMSLFVINYVINNFGITFLLFVLPIYSVIFASVAFFVPTIWIIAILAASKPMFYYGLFSVGREMILNVLPVQARLKGQFYLKVLCSPLGTVISSAAIYILGKQANIHIIIIFIIVVNLILMTYIRSIRNVYSNTLDKEIALKRFIVDDDFSQFDTESEKTIRASVIKTLFSEDVERKHFGLLLLKKVYLSKLPPYALQLIHYPNDTQIRLLAIDAVDYYKDVSSIAHLIQQLDQEENPQVIWHLYKTLANIYPAAGIAKTKKDITNDNPIIKAGAICILFKAGNLDEIYQAITELIKMINDPRPEVRQVIPEILSILNIYNSEKEFNLLINDANIEVCMSAIRALKTVKIPNTIPTMINHLLKTEGTSQVTLSTIKSYGKIAFPFLEKSIEANLRNPKVVPLIRILASMPFFEVEDFLLNLGSSKDTHIRTTVSYEMAQRAFHINIKSSLHAKIKSIIADEITLIKSLTYLSQKYQHDEIRNELIARINLAKTRILYWLAVYKQKPTILNIIPILLNGLKTEKAKALEYIDSLFINKLFVNKIISLFTGEIDIKDAEIPNYAERYLDEWLTRVIKFFKT